MRPMHHRLPRRRGSEWTDATPTATARRGIASVASLMFGASLLAGSPEPPSISGAESTPPEPPASTTPSEADERAMYFRSLGGPLGSRYSEIPGYDARWPFDGLIDPPATFPVAESPPPPCATVEWRHDGSALVESHASGTAEGQAICRRLRPDLMSLQRDGEPCPAWTSVDPDGNTGRGRWSSAFVDCYEVAPGGPWITITHRAHPETIQAHLVGFGADHRSIQEAGPPLSTYGVVSSSAIAGPLLTIADFDRNGSRDFLFGVFHHPLGLAHCHQDSMFILTDVRARTARVTRFQSIGTGFLDLDRNGRAEVLLSTFAGTTCLDGKPHNFWITRLLGFQNLTLVDLRDVHVFEQDGFTGRFPAFEWFAFDMQHRFKPLLSSEMKTELEGTRYPPWRRPGS